MHLHKSRPRVAGFFFLVITCETLIAYIPRTETSAKDRITICSRSPMRMLNIAYLGGLQVVCGGHISTIDA